ncbi:hypothetical protein [Terribacillus saccharophilus]|uniref:hypothetical protein n=1 Tax=Terribacillus saccharophilus TaxID=361277 RepID=UPI000C9B9094|nr:MULTISPECIES: hypothetical protein [Terribacillus]MCM3226481.1 hypothetical protein [Terribacillus saccharophilus]MEC0282218.1 hypothetical protein [Terribacillus saccharophilus]MEC0289023.1 hypothetical protein [Terribacillus saccharophilus]
MLRLFVLLILVLMLTACQNQSVADTKNVEAESLFGYSSIRDYMLNDDVDVVSQTDVLQISDGGDHLVYDLRIWVSPSLLEKLRDTEGNFYLTLQDLPGESLLESHLKKELQTVDSSVLLTGIDEEGYFTISQIAYLKNDTSKEEHERLMDPANYSFAFYDAEEGETAVTVGLDITTLLE